MRVVGFVDDRPLPGAVERLLFPLLGDRAWLCSSRCEAAAVALGIGDNYARMAVSHFLESKGFALSTVVSPSAFISPSARIGSGTVIMPGAVVNSMAVIGEGVIVNSCAVVEHDLRVGDFAHISPNATLGGGAEIGPLTHIAIGATVLPLVRIGERSILGAGSVAPRNIPDGVIAFGVPARVLRKLLREDETANTEIETGS
jgi:UDP-N-acetylbacillosamine N-acetyltransferase